MVVKKDYIDNYDTFDFQLDATIEAYMSGIDPHSVGFKRYMLRKYGKNFGFFVHFLLSLS